MSDLNSWTTCHLCGAIGLVPEHPPGVGDHKAWNAIGKTHNRGCFYVSSRASQRPSQSDEVTADPIGDRATAEVLAQAIDILDATRSTFRSKQVARARALLSELAKRF